MRFIHLSLIGYKCLFMNVNYKGQNLLFFLYVSLVTTVSEAWTSESRGRVWLIGNIVLVQNERLTRLRAHGAILQRDDNRSVVIRHPWGARTASQRWRCLEWCFQNSFKENRYFLYFVLLSLRRWSLNMCVRAHTTWVASINQTDETIASTSQRLRSEENLNDKYSSM